MPTSLRDSEFCNEEARRCTAHAIDPDRILDVWSLQRYARSDVLERCCPCTLYTVALRTSRIPSCMVVAISTMSSPWTLLDEKDQQPYTSSRFNLAGPRRNSAHTAPTSRATFFPYLSFSNSWKVLSSFLTTTPSSFRALSKASGNTTASVLEALSVRASLTILKRLKDVWE